MNCILEELKASKNAHSCFSGPNHTAVMFGNSNSCFIYKNHTAVSVVRCTQLFQRWIKTAEPYTAVSVWLPLLLLLFAVTGSSLILEQVDRRLFKLACLASTLWTFWFDAACCIWVPSTPWRKALTTRIMLCADIMSIARHPATFGLPLFLIVYVGYIRGGSGQVRPSGPHRVHTVTWSFFFHILQGRFERSDHSKLSLQPGKPSDPQDLSWTVDNWVLVRVVGVARNRVTIKIWRKRFWGVRSNLHFSSKNASWNCSDHLLPKKNTYPKQNAPWPLFHIELSCWEY